MTAAEAKAEDDGLSTTGPIIEVIDLVSAFGSRVIHDHLNLTVKRGEITGLVGGSGAGKSVLLTPSSGCAHRSRAW